MSCSTRWTLSPASPPLKCRSRSELALCLAPAPISPDTTACSPRTSYTATTSSPTVLIKPAREPHAPPPPNELDATASSASSTSTSNTVVCVAARCASSRASTLPRSSRGSSLISPPARPAPSTTPAHPRSVWAPRNPAPPITDHLLTAPTGAPRPRCASPAALRPTPCLTRSHHCRLHKISSPRPRNVCARTDNVPDNDHASSTTPLLLQQRRSAGYFAYP